MNSSNEYLIAFAQMDWSEPDCGIRQKCIDKDGCVMRLVEFSDGFVENDWCLKSHIGYVLEGSLTVEFSHRKQRFEQGDGIWITGGEEHKHKAVVNKGEKALLLLFE